jgi:hypothetical protein
MPRSAAACMSIEAFRGPVDAISFSRGSCCKISGDSGVRSRMTQTTSNGRSRLTTAGGISEVIREYRDLRTPRDRRPISQPQGDILKVIQDCNFHRALASQRGLMQP